MRGAAEYFRANPQVLVLLVVCVVLGLGTFIAVLIAIIGSGNSSPTGEPDGWLVRPLLHAALLARGFAV